MTTSVERTDLQHRAHRCFTRSGRALIVGAALALGCNAAALAATPSVYVDIYDRTEGQMLDTIAKAAARYVVGTPGHEYAIRIRNDSGQRILAVTSVDGVNVLSGETASPEQSGYVIEAGGSVQISGWRTSFDRTSAFYFTDLGDSYAARTGRPRNVGVIGVAVFRELQRPQSTMDLYRIAPPARAREERADVPAAAAPESRDAAAPAGAAGIVEPKTLASKLGTGFGRDESSPAQRVRFERETATPAETVSIQYDRRENLIAMGVLPSTRYAQRTPDPFPAMPFVPAPR